MQSTATPRFSELELDAWRGFLRSYATLVRELDEELTERHGLPLSSYDVLVQLDEAPDGMLRMSHLADAVLLSRSGLSRLVTRLADQGLLERVECQNDARGAFAAITATGRERLAEARATHRAGVRERFLDRLGEREQRQLAKAWSRLLDPR
ncbi:MAG TPA: MarR family transcriptional regulator [Thermoleophilaceae bacterium]|jgi:DNA-binding MarR family transcriptional regulator